MIRTKSPTGKILDNVVFLAEVFGDRDDKDIPKLPVLEMAQCFDLEPESHLPKRQSLRQDWSLWK